MNLEKTPVPRRARFSTAPPNRSEKRLRHNLCLNRCLEQEAPKATLLRVGPKGQVAKTAKFAHADGAATHLAKRQAHVGQAAWPAQCCDQCLFIGPRPDWFHTVVRPLGGESCGGRVGRRRIDWPERGCA